MRFALPTAVVMYLILSNPLCYAANASERRFIKEGMSEGEVIMKIGKPDSESTDSGGGANVTEKTLVYFPTSGDAQTLTTIKIRDGKVVEVSRKTSR